MSASKNFLTRWSRRKREAAEAETKSSAATEAVAQDPLVPAKAGTQAVDSEQAALDSRLRGNERESGSVGPDPKQPGSAEPAFDITKLPPLESITAETDIRAFLAPGVPPELTRAALRRAWSADPAIREFVGLSENSWDFNAPDAIPGFGPLQITDELRRQIARVVGAGSVDEADRPGAAASEAPEGQTSITTSAGSAATRPASDVQGEAATHPDQPSRTAELRDDHVSLQCKKDDAALQTDGEKAKCPQSAARRSHGRALPD
jgi:Protein of unknown function (DUF3306)